MSDMEPIRSEFGPDAAVRRRQRDGMAMVVPLLMRFSYVVIGMSGIAKTPGVPTPGV